HVLPVNNSNTNRELFVVIFEEIEGEEFFLKAQEGSSNLENRRILELEQELTATKLHLQTFIEELETSNEELQSLNEELMSTNEELQSSNEELETSNEELQSINEELNIAYSELKAANELLEKQGEKLRISESNLKALLDSTQQIFYLLDKNYRILVFNKTAAERGFIFFKQIMKTGDLIIDYIFSEDIEIFQKDFHAALHGNLIKGEICNLHPTTGEKYYYSYNLTPVLDNDKIEMVAYTLVDITELKRSQFKHKLNELFADAILRELNYGICILDDNKKIYKVNQSIEEILNLQESYILGKPFETFFKRLNNKSYDEENKNSKKVYFYETLNSKLKLETIEKPFLNEDGKKFTVLVMNQIPENLINKQIQPKYEDIDTIHWIVNEFGNSFYKIYEAIQKLERELVIEEKINTLDNLKAIVQENKIELLKLQSKIFENINKALDSISKQASETTLEDLVKKCKHFLAIEFPADYSRIEIEVESQNLTFQANDTLLILILKLLLSNSVRYSFPDKPIHIQFIHKNGILQLVVRDEGIGILETDLPKVGTPFFRGKNTLSIKGAGLSLAIVQSALKILQGEMRIESQASLYTKVIIQLPA
ncbi:MAG: ATP-binding protein, partial [Leptospiraceae bacterium]|nr:ATP-binding protein [Leptospiraceae bacterium]